MTQFVKDIEMLSSLAEIKDLHLQKIIKAYNIDELNVLKNNLLEILNNLEKHPNIRIKDFKYDIHESSLSFSIFGKKEIFIELTERYGNYMVLSFFQNLHIKNKLVELNQNLNNQDFKKILENLVDN